MKYKVAIIGTGYMAKKHCEMLYNHNDVILDTIVSTKKSQRISKQFIQKYGFLRNTTDFDSVLEDTTIDIVIICSPDFIHATQTVKSLRAGKHVLCEKPLARTEKDFAMIKKQLGKSHKTLQIGMNCRFREQYSKPKKIIDNKKLGELKFLHANYTINVVKSIKQHEKKWWLTAPKNIFPFLHGGGIHCIDLLRWNGGKIKKVFAKSTSLQLKKELKSDTFSVLIEFKNGVLGNCFISASTFQPNAFQLNYSLTNGSIINNTKIFKKKNNQPAFSHDIKIEQRKIDLRLQFDNMLQSIKSNIAPINSFKESYENFQVISAIENSVKKGTVISTI